MPGRGPYLDGLLDVPIRASRTARDSLKKRFFRPSNGVRRALRTDIDGTARHMTTTLDHGPRLVPHRELVTRGGTGFAFRMALADFGNGLALWPLCGRLGWN